MKHKQYGFSLLAILAIVLALAAIGSASYYVWHKNHSAKQNAVKQEPTSKPPETPAKTNDKYQGWKEYKNSAYRVRFKYPADWKIEEHEDNPATDSKYRQEYEIVVSRQQQYKYNQAVRLDVLDKSMEQISEHYNQLALDNPDSKQSTKATSFKGLNSVEYTFRDNPGLRRYLVSVGAKTYVVESFDTWFNENDPSYWQKFDLLIESLELK